MKKTICLLFCLVILAAAAIVVSADAFDEPVIVLQPQNYVFPENGEAIYTVKAYGNGTLTCNWFLEYGGVTYNLSGPYQPSPWEDHAGNYWGSRKVDENTFEYFFEGIKPGLDGASIYCVIEDGHNDVTSQKAIIMVSGEHQPPVISVPASMEVYQGTFLQLYCSATTDSGLEMSYIWYETHTGRLPEIKAVMTEDSYSDTFTVDTSTPGTRYYVCMVSLENGAYAYSSVIPVTVTEKKKPEPTPINIMPFTDVKEDDVFYDAVFWAYFTEPQVTTGVTPDRFGPDTELTRGMAVTFLWRACGCPNPENDPDDSIFVDLTADYYKTAVQWAVEQGITKGVDSTHFRPDGTLSLAHMVTFLYRTLGIGLDGWYQEAANWALGINLTEDISYAINPTVKCPRYATVLMLWRTVGDCWRPPLKLNGETAFFDMLRMTAGQIEKNFGALTFEYSDYGPGAPVYSVDGHPGVSVQFSFNMIEEELTADKSPVTVIITDGYEKTVFGAVVSDDIKNSAVNPWSSVTYIDSTNRLYLSNGVGQYYIMCLVDAAGVSIPGTGATAAEWNEWYSEYLSAPYGKIVMFRIGEAE